MFGEKAATVTLNNIANQWLIDDIKGVLEIKTDKI
jgi:hypothetical protein